MCRAVAGVDAYRPPFVEVVLFVGQIASRVDSFEQASEERAAPFLLHLDPPLEHAQPVNQQKERINPSLS